MRHQTKCFLLLRPQNKRILVLTHFTCPKNAQIILNGGPWSSAHRPTLGTDRGSLATRHPASLSPCSTVSNLEASNIQTTTYHGPSGVLEIVKSKNIRLMNATGPETPM